MSDATVSGNTATCEIRSLAPPPTAGCSPPLSPLPATAFTPPHLSHVSVHGAVYHAVYGVCSAALQFVPGNLRFWIVFDQNKVKCV